MFGVVFLCKKSWYNLDRKGEMILMNTAYYPGPFGLFRIVEEDAVIIAIDVVKEDAAEAGGERTELTDQAARELAEYLAGKRRAFTVPYRFKGTPFRLRVWQELVKVPYGHTTTYKQLAEAIGKPKAYHAVGGAVGANPLSIIVPCHRVIGSDGSLTGYAWGLPMKEALLKLEQGR